MFVGGMAGGGWGGGASHKRTRPQGGLGYKGMDHPWPLCAAGGTMGVKLAGTCWRSWPPELSSLFSIGEGTQVFWTRTGLIPDHESPWQKERGRRRAQFWGMGGGEMCAR